MATTALAGSTNQVSTAQAGTDSVAAIAPTAIDSIAETSTAIEESTTDISTATEYPDDDFQEWTDYDNDHIIYASDFEKIVGRRIASNITFIIALVIIIPCLTIGFIVWLIMRFFMRRHRERYTIIERAIDAKYTLPDSFYSGQPNNYTIINGEMTADNNAAYTTNNPHIATEWHKQPTITRDPKKFSSAVTLIAIGAAITLFFMSQEVYSLAFLAGFSLLFLGIGKLIGYFYLPSTPDNMQRPADRYTVPPAQQPPVPPYQTPHHNPNRPPFTPPAYRNPNTPDNIPPKA